MKYVSKLTDARARVVEKVVPLAPNDSKGRSGEGRSANSKGVKYVSKLTDARE